MTTKSKKQSKLKTLTHLGSQTTNYSGEYDPSMLESFDNQLGNDNWVSFVCTEFTSLCPKTGQPDFAKIFINYLPNKKMVESKSLKLYLFGFRNHGGFHEECVRLICDDIDKEIKPHFIEVIGEFTPRGGISIFPYSSKASKTKKYQEIKDTRIKNYSPGKYSCKLERVY
jgi:7-cyano-7-deazaguanine reductase